jgi:hypothetical protein
MSGHLRAKEWGYRKIWIDKNGSIPSGYDIHHVDFDHSNNSLENLELVDHETHMRFHAGWILENGEWWKPCISCGLTKRISTDFSKRLREDSYNYRVSQRCNDCFNGSKDGLNSAQIRNGWKVVDGELFKPCSQCGELKKVSTEFDKMRKYGHSRCKICRSYDRNWSSR